MDNHNLLKMSYCFSFSGAHTSCSGTKIRAYSHIVVSQLYNKVYIVHPLIEAILVFDLQGNYLDSIFIVIQGFRMGKLCIISENVLCICDIRPSTAHVFYFVTNEGIIITRLQNAPRRGNNFIDCISSEEHNVFYIVTAGMVYSYGKEGMLTVPGIKNCYQHYPSIRGLRIIDKDMNLLLCCYGSMYTYSSQENKLNLLVHIEQRVRNFEVLDGYVFCFSEFQKLLIISLDTKKVVTVDNISNWPIVPSVKASYSGIHFLSRKIYIGYRNNIVSVHSIDNLLDSFHKNNHKSLIMDRQETPEYYYEIFK